jgi:hypothetical protein
MPIESVIRTGLVLVATSIMWAAQDPERQTTYQFTSFAVCPGCPTNTGGINDEGLAGAASPSQGYLYDSRTMTATAVPGALAVTIPGDNGVAPGITITPAGIVPVVREPDGTVITLPGFPGAAITAILEFNRGGAGVGWASYDFQSFFSFERFREGVYTRIDYPGPFGSLTLGTFILGWNQLGTMVGYIGDPTETQAAGIIRHPDGTWERFEIAGSNSTIIYAINESGVLAGGYRDPTGWHGFLWDHGTFQRIDVPGAVNTTVSGINNHRELVGMTFTTKTPLTPDGSGFIAVPRWGQ